MDKQKQLFIKQWHGKFPGVAPPELKFEDAESIEQELVQVQDQVKLLEEQLSRARFLMIFLQTSVAANKKTYERKRWGYGSSVDSESEPASPKVLPSSSNTEGPESAIENVHLTDGEYSSDTVSAQETKRTSKVLNNVKMFGHITEQPEEDASGRSPPSEASGRELETNVGIWDCTSGLGEAEPADTAHSVRGKTATTSNSASGSTDVFITGTVNVMKPGAGYLHKPLAKSRSVPANAAKRASVPSGDGCNEVWLYDRSNQNEVPPHVSQSIMPAEETSESSDLEESSSNGSPSGSPSMRDGEAAKFKTFPGCVTTGSPFHKLSQARTTNERIDALGGGRESYYGFEDEDYGDWVCSTPDQRSLNDDSDDGTDEFDKVSLGAETSVSIHSVADGRREPSLQHPKDAVDVDNQKEAEYDSELHLHDSATKKDPDSSPTHYRLPSSSENVSGMVDYQKVRSIAEAEKLRMRRWVLSSLLDNEEMFLEYLDTILLYMKALKATITTSMPVMSSQDFDTLFYRVPELRALHAEFYEGLMPRLKDWSADTQIGDLFLRLLSKLYLYEDYVNNYKKAQHTVEKCAKENEPFADIIEGLKVKSRKREDLESISLIDILYKPAERVMRNTLVLQDILKHTPHRHPDYRTLRQALKQAQQFLNRINASSVSKGRKAPSSASLAAARSAKRELVKDGYLVEVSPESGAQRKLRHLFLFSDLLLCAKQKQGVGMFHSKESYECKWYIPLADLSFKSSDDSEGAFEVQETSEGDLRDLSNRSMALKKEIALEKKKLSKRKGNSGQEDSAVLTSRQLDRSRKKLNEVEAQIILSAPSLPLRIDHMQGKSYIFLMSSDYERAEWTEAIANQQESCFKSFSLASIEVQALLAACVRKRKVSKVGTMLASEDEDLLSGYLTVTVHSGEGFLHPCYPYVTLEVDSYGHFQTKAKTRFCENTQKPKWETEFELEMDGAQTLRILCYDRARDPAISYSDDVLIAKGKVALDHGTLRNHEWVEVNASMNEIQINVSFKFMPREQSLRRLPSRKTNGLFGVKIQAIAKRERGQVPNIVKHCVQEIERRGMEDVGIYRVSGVASEVKELKAYFETNRKDVSLLLSNIDINVVAGVLKLYFRELPEPLFTDAKYSDFVGAVHLTDPETKHSAIGRLLADLPAANYHTFVYLREHLLKVAKNNSVNKMTLHNLATVFGPTLLRPADDTSKKNAKSPDAMMLSAMRMDVHHQVGVLLYCLELPKMPELGFKTTGSKLIAEMREDPLPTLLTVDNENARLKMQKPEKPPKLAAGSPSASQLRQRYHNYEEVSIGLSGKSPPKSPNSTNNNNNSNVEKRRSHFVAAVPTPRVPLIPKPTKPTPAPRKYNLQKP